MNCGGGEERETRTSRVRRSSVFGLLFMLFFVHLILQWVTGVDVNFIWVALAGAFGAWAAGGVGWAWIPAVVFTVLALDPVFGGSAEGGPILPLIVMAAGGLLVFRDRLSHRTVKLGLIGLAVFGLIAAGDHDHERDRDIRIFDGRPPRAPEVPSTPLAMGSVIPSLGDRTLIITTDSDDVDITARRGLSAPQVVGDDVRVSENAETVTVRAARGSDDIDLLVPADAKVIVTTDAGDVDVDWTDGVIDMVVKTDNGSVDVVMKGEPAGAVRTESGDIDLEGFDGEDPDSSFILKGSAGHLAVETEEGDIELEKIPLT